MPTDEQLAFYNENGYVLAKLTFPREESLELRTEAHALADRLARHANIDATWGSARKAVENAQESVWTHVLS